MISEDQYYEHMNSFEQYNPTDTSEITARWEACFDWILRHYKVGYRTSVIKDLFYNWEMANWEALWPDPKKLAHEYYKEFCDECRYICDRASYDKLFRTHWLFRQAFPEVFK